MASSKGKGARRSSRTDPGAESSRPSARDRIDTPRETWEAWRLRGFQLVPVPGPPPRFYAVLSPDGSILASAKGWEATLVAFFDVVDIFRTALSEGPDR